MREAQQKPKPKPKERSPAPEAPARTPAAAPVLGAAVALAFAPPAPRVQRCAVCGGDDEPVVQRQCTECTARGTAADVAGYVRTLPAEAGARLPDPVRAAYEGHFREDLSDVRIHTDAAAGTAASGLRAAAFTHDSHIVFAPGRFSPATRAGTRLLAHELTHVIQQRSASAWSAPVLDGGPSDPLEQAAVRESERFASHEGARPAPAPVTAAPLVSRAPNDEQGQPTFEKWFDAFKHMFESPESEALVERRSELDSLILEKIAAIADQMISPQGDLAILVALKLELAALNREQYLDEVALANVDLWRQKDEAPDDFVKRLTAAATSEEVTIGLIEQIAPEPGHLSEPSRDIILQRPELFPRYQIKLYAEAVDVLRRQSDDYYDQYKARLAPIVDRPPTALLPDFVWMLENRDELRKSARDMGGMTIFLLDTDAPVSLDVKPSAPKAGVGDISVRINDRSIDRLPKAVGEKLGALYMPLVSYYYYDFYAETAEAMGMFSLALDQTLERLNRPGEMPNVAADLQRAYHVQSPQVGWDTMEKAFDHIYRDVEAVMDEWVRKLPWYERIREGFGLYDLPAEIVDELKAMLTWTTLAMLVGFVALILGLQFVPFGNLVIDALLLGAGLMLGVDILKAIGIFGYYFDRASDAQRFEELYRAAQTLKGGGAPLLNILIELATLAVGGAFKQFIKFRKLKKLKAIEDLADEDAIARGSPAVRKAFEEARTLGRKASKWEEALNAETRQALEHDKDLAKVFREMDPEVRELLTHCASVCIPIDPRPSPSDVSKIDGMLKRLKVSGSHKGLKEYFHVNRMRLSEAVKDVVGAASRAELEELLERSIEDWAKLKGGSARIRSDGLWEFVRKDGSVIRENEVASHAALTGEELKSNGFFQSHHGIQDAWARTRIPGDLYSRAEGKAILLRDSRMGTPHQIVNSRQVERFAELGERTYAEERLLLLEDMDAAAVSKATARKLLADSDAYFAEIYRRLAAQGDKSLLKSIFGKWKP